MVTVGCSGIRLSVHVTSIPNPLSPNPKPSFVPGQGNLRCGKWNGQKGFIGGNLIGEDLIGTPKPKPSSNACSKTLIGSNKCLNPNMSPRWPKNGDRRLRELIFSLWRLFDRWIFASGILKIV